MPHVVLKMYPGRTAEQKQRLTDSLVKSITEAIGVGEETVSVELAEIERDDWKSHVFDPEIAPKRGTLAKEPGYTP